MSPSPSPHGRWEPASMSSSESSPLAYLGRTIRHITKLPGIWAAGGGGGAEYTAMTAKEGRAPSFITTVIVRLLPTTLVLFLGIFIGVHYPSYLSIYSRRSQTIPSLLPRSLLPPPSSLVPPVATLPPPDDPVPNIVHYVYGLATGPQPDFPYFAYLAMRSAMVTLKPDRILFHCIHEPEGYWWDRVRGWEGWEAGDGMRKGHVEIVPARDVQTVGKDQRPVHHFAHKADILRLEVLLEYGGIYLDIDTFVLRPFADYSLLSYDTVLGIEASRLTFWHKPGFDDEMQPKGLCNAVIIARRQATFLQRWLESYEEFQESKWTEHSVEMPWTLAKLYPTTVTVLSERAFFWPLWTDDHIHAVYGTTEYNFDESGQLAYHAWESKAKPYLSALDPASIQTFDTSFTRMARRFREPDEEWRWRAHGRLNGAGSGTGLGKGDEESEREEVARRNRFYRETAQ